MKKVLAFDIAGTTGIAFGAAGETPRATTVDLGKGRSEDARFAKLIQTTRVMLRKFQPDIVVFEAPVGGRETSHFLVGLVACFRGAATMEGFEPKALHLSSVRKHFVGKNLIVRDFPTLNKSQAKAEIKKIVVQRCYQLGWHVRGHDEADALALWDYACATMCGVQAAPAGGLFHA